MARDDSRRPSAATSKLPSAPSVLTMNGHFAQSGYAATTEQYEAGIQVIDEDKEFKWVLCQNGVFKPFSNALRFYTVRH